MYIISIYIIFLVLKISYCVNYYAGFSFNYSDIDSHVPILGSFYNKLYFFYSNTLVNNGEKKFDYTYHQLDNIPSGLSLFTDPVYDLDKIPSSAKNKHLLGTLESWCYTLTLFLFYPKFSNDIAYKDSNVYDHLFNRCMNLNNNFTNYKNDFDFVEFLNNTDTKLDDIYLFEKFSRMCPRPCYLDKDKLGSCSPSSKISDLELLNEFVSNPKCYINDFLSYECIPYSYLKRKTVNSFKSLLNPDSNIQVYSNKYSYLYMPKRAELGLSMDDLSYQIFVKLVRNCNTKNCNEVKDLFTTMALKNFMVKFVVGEIDLNSKNPKEKFKISFGVTFYIDEFRAKNINHVFDFLIKNVDFNVLYDVLLGPQPLKVNEENEKSGEDKPKSFKERYNKYIQEKLNKKVIDTKPKPQISDFFSNKFEFLNMSGYGQHREVTFSMELNTDLLKRLKPIDSKYYLKLTHILDTSVYIDNDELHGTFNLLKEEIDAFDLPTNHVLEEDGVGKVVLKALKTPFIDIEQPEMNSSPVIYNGYVVLEESVLNLKRLVITLTLNVHTRYMHMLKATTSELFKVDNFRILRNQIGTDYSLSIIAQPKLHILNPFTPFENVSLNRSYLRYLRFLRDISFTMFSSSNNGNKEENGLKQTDNTWVPVFFSQCNNVGVSAKLCQGYRTGLAISTKVINTFFCNPIIREIGGDVIDSSCYMFFSVPVGNQNEYPFIKNVTFFTLLVSCIGSLIMVLRYIDSTLKNVDYNTKETKFKS